ncbi:MAG: hypothetical protein IJU70_10375 [Lentisphaeria bacterium]|nr:hypothetical protein [Lentisphaeria bacterium]
MTCFEAERQLVLFLAETLGLVPDREIFSNALPDGVPEGVWAKFEQGSPATPSCANSFTAVVRGRCLSREECADKAASIAAALPVFGISGLLAVRVAEGMQIAFYQPEKSDPPCFEFSIRLAVSFI